MSKKKKKPMATPTRIIDAAACLRIEVGEATRLINKGHIRNIEIVNGRICINTGQGQLQQVFIDFADVEEPGAHTIEELVSAMQDMMRSRENYTIGQLDTVIGAINELRLILNGTNDYFKEPQLIVATVPGVTYKGYSSVLNADRAQPVWAIQRIKDSSGTTTLRWAEGTKDFLFIMDDYLHYTY